MVKKSDPTDTPKRKPKSLTDLRRDDFDELRNSTELIVKELENAAMEHISLAVEQTKTIQSMLNRSTKSLLERYSPDFVQPYIRQVDMFIQPYMGQNLQRTFTTQYESAYLWLKTVTPAPVRPLLERFDQWVTPLKAN